MMNTLVPTAVFSSYPSTEVRIRSIIMPPPAPTKPQISPITVPQTADRTARFRGATLIIASFVVMTGRTMNLIPRRNVMKTEKLPIAADGRRLATKLPRTVNASTLAIMIRPFFMSRFLLFP